MWMLLEKNLLVQAVEEEFKEEVSMMGTFFDTLPEKLWNLGLRVLLACFFLFIGLQTIKILRKFLKRTLKRSNADLGVIQFLDSFTKFSLTVLLLFMIGSSFGVDATSIVALVGSAGVAIGLALQGSLSNFAGGVLILLLKPFRVGDYIKEDNKGNEGTVSEIQMFYTKLVTPDDKVIVLPNGTLANTSLTNVTHTFKRRLDLLISVSYQADLKKAKAILSELLEKEPKILSDTEKRVYVSELGDSAVILGLRCWVTNEDYWDIKWQLNEEIKERFDQNNIEIPYQKLDVCIREKQ